MFMRGLLLLSCLTVSLGASAQFINAGFENPVQSDGTFGNTLPGWTATGGNAGAWNIFPSYSFFRSEAPEGTQIAYVNGTSLAQQSAVTLAAGETTLSVMAGRRSDTFAASFDMELWAGGTVAAGVVTGGTLLGTASFIHTSIAPSSFTPLSVTYNASVNDPLIGQKITARFVRVGGSQMNFDDVRLNVVPEPATMSVLVIGLVAALRRSRKS